MSDTTEPAIPIHNVKRGAAIPLQAQEDLLQLARADGLASTGLLVSWNITEGDGANVKAVATVMRAWGGKLDAGVSVTYHGRPVTYAGFIQWTRQD